MNATLNTIYTRRAVRKYLDKTVDRQMIEEILDAGRMAPSAINLQPWKFYVLTKKEDISAFSHAIKTKGIVKGMLKSGAKQIVKTAINAMHFPRHTDYAASEDAIFHGAPVVIFIASARDNEWAPLDVGMCAQNMMLAAKSLGLDSCPIGMGKYAEYTDLYPRLNIPKSEHLNLALIFGYANETPEVHERKKDNVFWI